MAILRIPEFITVHLGDPNDPDAPNVRVPFIDYIKNVASSEIYPTWPDNAIRANIYAQVSFALNRIFTEYYPSRGYNFDITSSTIYDQSFVRGRSIYENIDRIVDDIFNDYIVRQGFIEPLLAQYCNGTTIVCEGLSQWGTVDLARDGLTPYEILQYYYGEDINIVFNAPTATVLPSYPGRPLRLGSAGEDVRTIQRQLNRIGQNYPSIPPILETDGVFDVETENAVKKFQEIFNLEVDGIVGKGTWYKVKSIFNAVKRLGELQSEGLTLSEVDRIFEEALGSGDSGENVRTIQYYLAVIACFDNSLPLPSLYGEFDEQTEEAVRAFQKQQGIAVDGIVGRDTWNALTLRYEELLRNIQAQDLDIAENIYPGRALSEGMQGEDVRQLQRFINRAAEKHPYIPRVAEDGIYGPATATAVRTVQSNNGLAVNGVTGAITWDTIVRLAVS